MTSDAPLLNVECGEITLSIDGPVRHPRGVLTEAGAPSTGQFKIEATDHTPAAKWLDQSGSSRDWSPESGAGPILHAETDYRLTVQAPPGSRVAVANRDPNLLKSIVEIPGQPHIRSGRINFRNQVGLADLEVLADGKQIFTIAVEVFPTKIAYESDYESVLADIGRTARALALEYLRATYRRGETIAPDDGASSLEWLLLLRSQIDQLDRSLQYIASDPHRVLIHDETDHRLDRIKRVTPITLRAVARRLGSGPLRKLPTGEEVHAQVPAGTRVESLDSPEHRWLRSQLHSVQRMLAQIASDLEQERQRVLRRYARANVARIDAEIEEVQESEAKVARMLRTAPVAAAGGPPPHGFASLTLMGRSGYREAYQSLMTLQLGIAPSSGNIDVSVSDLDQLYETWCYLKITTLIASATTSSLTHDPSFPISQHGLRVDIGKGSESAITLRTDDLNIRVVNNLRIPGDTGSQKPDIVVQLSHEGWPPIFLIFDAKYRVDASKEYVEQFGGFGPPVDAVNALHRYRDAITVQGPSSELGRPVVKGAALFPLSSELSKDFDQHRLYRSLSSIGVGALPLLPNNSSWVEQWLDSFLSNGPTAMADPGPPFLAHEHARSVS